MALFASPWRARVLAMCIVMGSVAAQAQTTPAQVSERNESGGSAAAAEAKQDPALAARLPEAIRNSGTIIVGAQLQQPPEDFYAADGRTPVGFEVDLAKAIGNTLGVKIDYRPMEFGALITALRSGRVNMTMSAMNDTKQREQTVDFVDYYNAGITMLVQKGNPEKITGPDTLCGKSVSAQPGTTQQAFAEDQGKKCQAAGKPTVTIVSGTANADVALHTGRFAAILDDTPTALYDAQVAGNGAWFEPVDYPPINGGPYGIGVNKEDVQLRDVIRDAMQKLIDGGAYGKILAAWGMSAGAVQKASVNGAP
ncbi:MAG: ABC transporter substrate-binding protein [Acidisphaera sp.]|nr:ABC transporter substrate-binding protein [Acidisphaera sp.]MBV9812660.1 ABC transporter substrate-binding protein [Acetobacteraceae bacterium]